MRSSSSFCQYLIALCAAFAVGSAFAEDAVPAAPAAAAQEAVATAPAVAAAPANQAAIDCVEVKLFAVSADKVEGQTDRADLIPAQNLVIIRDDVIRHLPAKARGVTAVIADQAACPNAQTAAVLSGDILDFRKGNMALRYFVGFGAGSQKVRVRLTLTGKASGAVIAQSEIADTKWGGAFGGTNTKGLDDFAEKAAMTAADGIKSH